MNNSSVTISTFIFLFRKAIYGREFSEMFTSKANLFDTEVKQELRLETNVDKKAEYTGLFKLDVSVQTSTTQISDFKDMIGELHALQAVRLRINIKYRI
jgi:hypothetical protein